MEPLMTPEQEAEIAEQQLSDLRSMGFTEKEARNLKNNEAMRSEIKLIWYKYAMINTRFGPAIREFDLIVPKKYDHDKQIDNVGRWAKRDRDIFFYKEDLTSKNFANATNRLERDKKYRVKFFPILALAKGSDCVSFLLNQGAILVGGQGMALVYDLFHDKLLKGKNMISFDKKDALWMNPADGHYKVPRVLARSEGDGFKFGFSNFDEMLNSDNYLLGFFEVPMAS